MKLKLLRVLFWISVANFALGLLVSVGSLFEPVSTAGRAGGGLLLMLGAFGCWWYGAAIQRSRREVSA